MLGSVKCPFVPQFHETAVTSKRKKLLEIRWYQNSRIVEGFHPLFHESDLAPLFHPLSALFRPSFNFDDPVRGQNFVPFVTKSGLDVPPGAL